MTLSYKVFMSFVKEDGDTTQILSTECYDKWVATRKSALKQPEESFRRVLTAHICGMDGRRPFPEEVEKNLLKDLRKREIWACFKGTGTSIGIRGFRNVGYHEAIKQKESTRLNPDISTTADMNKDTNVCGYDGKEKKKPSNKRIRTSYNNKSSRNGDVQYLRSKFGKYEDTLPVPTAKMAKVDHLYSSKGILSVPNHPKLYMQNSQYPGHYTTDPHYLNPSSQSTYYYSPGNPAMTTAHNGVVNMTPYGQPQYMMIPKTEVQTFTPAHGTTNKDVLPLAANSLPYPLYSINTGSPAAQPLATYNGSQQYSSNFLPTNYMNGHLYNPSKLPAHAPRPVQPGNYQQPSTLTYYNQDAV